MTQAFTISLQSDPASADVSVVREGLARFNFDAAGDSQFRAMTLFARDHAGVIRGGLLGYVWGRWLHITELWVERGCRRRGLGTQLLAEGERQAALLGARGAFLSTFDFQAPEFYRHRGYQVFGALRDYPPGHSELYLRKRLGA